MIVISIDKNKINLDLTHSILTNSYWSKGVSKKDVKKGIDNSICFGVYKNDKQIGFARVITDSVSFGYISDLFIIEPERSHGYSKQLMNAICFHQNLKEVKNWYLVTKDAQGLYKQSGFDKFKLPNREIMYVSNKNLKKIELQK